MKKDVWIIVANSTCARLFKAENSHNIVEMEALVNPEGRMHPRDLVSDRPGRGFESANENARHAYESKVSPHDQTVIDFAKMLCNHIALARSRGEIKKIYLAATPAFLGLIRQNLNPQIAQLISAEVIKDIVHLKPNEILEYFMVTT